MKLLSNLFYKFVCISIFVVIIASCTKSKSTTQRTTLNLSGPALGTLYNITIQSKSNMKVDGDWVSKIIQEEIQLANDTFSNWEHESLISRLNRLPKNTPIKVSPGFLYVFKKSQYIQKLSKGKFDPAQSLVFDLWGFGIHNQFQNIHIRTKKTLPSIKEINKVLSISGIYQYRLIGNKIAKKHSKTQLNFSGIAKGYLVDRLFNRIYKKYQSIMVEVGGEIRTGSYLSKTTDSENPQLKFWKIGIERPMYNQKRQIFKVARLKNISMASSGNYRNYFTIKNGSKDIVYSHIIDPTTGFPVTNKITSATVVGKECMVADALATTLMIVDPQQGIKLMDKFPGYEAMLILKPKAQKPTSFTTVTTPNMNSYLTKDFTNKH